MSVNRISHPNTLQAAGYVALVRTGIGEERGGGGEERRRREEGEEEEGRGRGKRK